MISRMFVRIFCWTELSISWDIWKIEKLHLQLNSNYISSVWRLIYSLANDSISLNTCVVSSVYGNFILLYLVFICFSQTNANRSKTLCGWRNFRNRNDTICIRNSILDVDIKLACILLNNVIHWLYEFEYGYTYGLLFSALYF